HKIVTMMTGIPSVIYGFVGIFLLVPLLRSNFDTGSGMSILAASLMLTLLVSPTMILIFCDSFSQVPTSYGNAVLAMGGSPTQKFLYAILPSSHRGIFVGFALALGRALGDTLIALMIAGNAIQVPGSVLDSGRTLTAHIALVFAADYESPEFKAIFACAIVLYFLSGLLALAIRVTRSKPRRWA
ncbi:MAG: ABC transporter permease subunit, partial [Thermodesulfobacteriota bacterium]|nr:ABC transporter permease subunit [Thermodesulfobacteriota bacterium]